MAKMDKITLDTFKHLLAEHPQRAHPFFRYLNEKAERGLTVEEYQALAVNYIARTLFTIPEVVGAVQNAALDLRKAGTTSGALSLFDEVGEGDVKKNHVWMMVNAINYHGKAVYGDKYKTVNPKHLMDIIKLAHHAAAANSLEKTVPIGVLVTPGSVVADMYETKREFMGRQNRRIARQLQDVAPGKKLSYPISNTQYESSALAELARRGVCKEVVDYGIQQLKAIASEKDGKMAGYAYAHESLADEVMLGIFKILYNDVRKYKDGEAEFNREVYPYFRAHGDYKAMARGEIKVGEGGGTEALHAQREEKKLHEIINRGPVVTKNAYQGAEEFIDRQERVWDGIMSSMKAAKLEPASSRV
jgi:hypothetical protein